MLLLKQRILPSLITIKEVVQLTLRMVFEIRVPHKSYRSGNTDKGKAGKAVMESVM